MGQETDANAPANPGSQPRTWTAHHVRSSCAVAGRQCAVTGPPMVTGLSDVRFGVRPQETDELTRKEEQRDKEHQPSSAGKRYVRNGYTAVSVPAVQSNKRPC